MKFRIFLLAALLMLLCSVAFAETDITGEWHYIGALDNGDFIPAEESYTYTLKTGGSLTYAGPGFSVSGFWVNSNGVNLIFADGGEWVATLLDNGTLLLGNHITGMVFSRDGIPAFAALEPGMTEDGFLYEQQSDGTLVITGHKTNDEPCPRDENGFPTKALDLVIPARINGLTVASVANGAFYGNRQLRTVVIPDGVRHIGRDAFADCSFLTAVTIPETVNAIERYAFSGCERLVKAALPASLQELTGNPFADCESLTAIELAQGNRWFTVKDGALIHRTEKAVYAFPCGSGQTVYTVPENVTHVELAAFMGCRNLQEVILHEGVTRIDSYAFERSGLTHITLPAGLTRLGSNPFATCYSLACVDVEAGNARYRSMDGVLFDQETDALIYYPAGKTDAAYSIPQGTKVIDWDAFVHQSHLTAITVADTVERIEGYAFYGMERLNSITIPDSVTHLVGCAFGECMALESLELPASITQVAPETFVYSGLKRLTVAEGTVIDELAFAECGKVEVIFK